MIKILIAVEDVVEEVVEEEEEGEDLIVIMDIMITMVVPIQTLEEDSLILGEDVVPEVILVPISEEVVNLLLVLG